MLFKLGEQIQETNSWLKVVGQNGLFILCTAKNWCNMPKERSRSPDYQRKWYWYQDPTTGWWSWHYHDLDWTPPSKVQGGAASSTSTVPPLETAETGSNQHGQAMMEESKEKEAVTDMDVDG